MQTIQTHQNTLLMSLRKQEMYHSIFDVVYRDFQIYSEPVLTVNENVIIEPDRGFFQTVELLPDHEILVESEEVIKSDKNYHFYNNNNNNNNNSNFIADDDNTQQTINSNGANYHNMQPSACNIVLQNNSTPQVQNIDYYNGNRQNMENFTNLIVPSTLCNMSNYNTFQTPIFINNQYANNQFSCNNVIDILPDYNYNPYPTYYTTSNCIF